MTEPKPRQLTAAEMEMFLGRGIYYESMSLKLTVQDLGEFEINCSPGEFKFQVVHEYEDPGDVFNPLVICVSEQLVLKLELRPRYQAGARSLGTLRQSP